MQRFETVDVAYYSGTGGSARFARAISDALREKGVQARLRVICSQTVADGGGEAGADLLVLLYPVYAMNPPALVEQWLAAHPAKGGAIAAVLPVSGGGDVFPNRACHVRAVRAAKKAGYRVVYERMLVMPSNIFEATPDDFALRLLGLLPARAGQIADELLCGVTRRMSAPILDRVASFFGLMERFGARRMGAAYFADDSCNGCGLCETGCPQGNIALHGAKPTFGDNCALCLHCVYACPKHAIQNQYKMVQRWLVPGYDIAKLDRRVKSGEVPAAMTKFDRSMRGVYRYLTEVEEEKA